MFFWVRFNDRASGCLQAPHIHEAMRQAELLGDWRTLEPIARERNPRLLPTAKNDASGPPRGDAS